MSKGLLMENKSVEPKWFDPPYHNNKLFPDELDIQRYEYLNLSEEKQFEYRENLRLHFLDLMSQGHGIFSPNKSINEIICNIRKLIIKKNVAGIVYLKGNKYLYHSHLNVSNQWFPDMFDTKINHRSCLFQIRNTKDFHSNFNYIFIDDKHEAGLKNKDSNWVSDSLVDSMRIVKGFQPAFNYPATLAKFIYLYYHELEFQKDKEFRVLDACAGWAGRLTGLLAAFCTPVFDKVKVSYHCTDVNTNTKGRFEKIVGFWNHYINSKIEQNFDFYRSFIPAEELLTDTFFSNKENYYDFSFTSPPYYNREVYSNDITQSCNRYKTYYEWREGFLYGFLVSTYRLLKPNAHFWLNIADINTNSGDKSFYHLESDAIKYAKEIGFKHIDTFYMIQHPFPGSYSTKNITELEGKRKKYEPIFVFQK